MKHMRQLIFATQAFRRIFLPPVQVSKFQPFRHTSLPSITQSRFISRSRRPSKQDQQKEQQARQIRDEEIKSEFIQLVNEDGGLNPPVTLEDALMMIQRPDNFILQVSPGSRFRPPVCKIVNRFEMREHERAKAKAAHVNRSALKQIELNWAIDAHDLSHRLKQLIGFLEKGRKVEIILTKKRGKRAPNVEEVKHVMDSVLQATKEADAMQVKPMEGEPGKHVVLVVKKKDQQ
ncbi:translation initiation factor IF-3, C-terminal domain-containing protein [Aspergillus avenaceus]|uniref:Translation initiation factor IF-3, C-terminal domain-containing protein n=1 Tax=Aspergillus avenaceus TaxID=36643 RepID=A0A5N6TTE6_ASPAV|nr:translation initiation factor IF-3, C-terminal domain-containing protein [Aspergillus avenaceus]